MEYQETTNLLHNTSNQPSKFRTKNWIDINDDSSGTYNTNSQIKYNRIWPGGTNLPSWYKRYYNFWIANGTDLKFYEFYQNFVGLRYMAKKENFAWYFADVSNFMDAPISTQRNDFTFFM